MNRTFVALLALFLLPPLLATGQTLDIRDAMKSFATLSNTAITMTGRAELRVTGAGDPIPGCVIHLNSPDAWLLLPAIAPSQVVSSFLGRVRVNGASAVLDGNVRVAQYAQGAVVIPQSPDFAPLEVFDGRHFAGPSRQLDPFVKYDVAQLGAMATNIASFKLKRGYQVTFATEENGTGHRTADAADEVGGSPATLQVNYRTELPLGGYARWATAHTNVSSPTADLDGDGYDNFFEYAVGLDPAVPDHDALSLVLDNASLHFTYTRAVVVTDVSYQVEWAGTIGSTWSSAGVTQQMLGDSGVTRTIRATLPKGATGQRFVRLKATQR